MPRLTKAPLGVLIAALLGLYGTSALSHGDVTPHPVDTTGLAPLGEAWVLPNPYRGNEQAAAIGAVGYLHNCAGCHGLNAISGGIAPDLLTVGKDCLDKASKADQADSFKDTDEYFKGIVHSGKKTSDGRYVMPAYGDVFTQEAVWAIKAYIDARSVEMHGK